MRTKNNPFVYGVIVILTVMLSVACSVSDSPVSQKSPEVPDVSGVWWAYYDSQGTCSLPYTHVGQALCLNADGKGYVATFYYDDDKELIGTEGGLHFASFTYNVDENGYISFKMDNDFFSYEDSYLLWMLKYRPFSCQNSVTISWAWPNVAVISKAKSNLAFFMVMGF